jgi:ATP-dependent Clp protease adaptor protein ClpS
MVLVVVAAVTWAGDRGWAEQRLRRRSARTTLPDPPSRLYTCFVMTRLQHPLNPRTTEQTDAGTQDETRLDRLWNVVVWNDPINLMVYVVYVFQRLFGFPMEKATRLMLQVHHEGRSIVATVEREKGEYWVGRLHAYGLQATLEKVA